MKDFNEDKRMNIDLFQTEYKMFIEELKEKGYCSDEDKQKMLEMLDKADKIMEDMKNDTETSDGKR